MIIEPYKARQPVREAWSLDKLFRKRAYAMEHALDKSSKRSYASALNSYLSFCDLHNLPVDPTPDTLSFFVTFMCDHIEPRSVRNYLCGICNGLENIFPEVREARRHVYVRRTMAGCLRIYSKPTSRKEPLSMEHLILAMNATPSPASHDDLLFISQLLTGFRGLLWLGELTRPDSHALRDRKKLSLRSSFEWLSNTGSYSFWLPRHKVDKSFQGARIIISPNFDVDVLPWMRRYLRSRDVLFPQNPYLWITSDGMPPTRGWFMRRFRQLIPNRAWSGQSMRAGSAMFLAEQNTPYDLIQGISRWSSESFRIYICRNPTLLAILIKQQNLKAVKN
jgi:hypothetical protein